MMHLQPGAPQPQANAYLEIAQLYYLLRLRSLSNPLFLNRTLRSCRSGARRRRKLLCLSDMLPIKLCQLTSGVAGVRKCLALLVSNIHSDNDRFSSIACFLVKKEKLIDSAQYQLPDSHMPGTLIFLPFEYDFMLSHYDERDWIIVGYVYHQGDTEPQAVFELDLGHLFKNYYRRLSQIVIDVALEHPIRENEVGRMQLQLSWWFRSNELNPEPQVVSPRRFPSTGEITFKYAWAGGKERHCETLQWTARSRCPLCFSILPDVKSLVLHISLSHDRLDARYYGCTIFIEPAEECDDVEPSESMVILGGSQRCRSLTECILKDRHLTARQAGVVDDDRKRRRTVVKSVQAARQNSAPSKPSGKRTAKINGKVSCTKEKTLRLDTFYHGSSFVPVRLGHSLEGYKDSDLEIDDSWIVSQQNQTIAMFEDVENDEKELMVLWNEMRMQEPNLLGDKDVAPFCEKFVKVVREQQRHLRKSLLHHLLVLWEFGLLSSSELKKIVSIYDGRD